MTRILYFVAIFALFAAGGWYFSGGTTATSSQGEPFAASAQTTDAEVDVSTIQEMSIGNLEAAVEVIEYASYTCPHCANFHNSGYKQLKSDFIDTGLIKFTYREVYFDRVGLWASMVARCGGEEKFFGLTDLIYTGQSQWARAGEPAAIVEELRKIGRLAGFDSDTLEACLQDADKARTLATWFEQNAETHDITSTPSFIIDGKKTANMPYEDMKQIIQEAIDSK